MRSLCFGAIAQLGERLHGMQEVRGSIPRSSTKVLKSRLFLGGFFASDPPEYGRCIFHQNKAALFS